MLSVHAGHVREAAGQFAQAAEAGETVRADPGAYGQLCSFLPAIFDPFQNLATQTLRDYGSVLDSAADALDATAAAYNRCDSSVQDGVTGVSKHLDGSP